MKTVLTYNSTLLLIVNTYTMTQTNNNQMRFVQGVKISRYFGQKNVNWSNVKYIPLQVLIAFASLFLLSILAISSADKTGLLFTKQILSLPVFLFVLIYISILNPAILKKYSYHIYLVTLAMLMATCIFGSVFLGARRWLNLGIISLQPSELMKIGLIFAMAKHFSQARMHQISSVTKIIKPILIGVIPTAITMLQPDLGTACVLIWLFVVIMFISGVKMWKFALCGVIILISAPVIWSKLHDYQKKRVMTFINPETDKLGSGYNITQAKIAIGGGQFFGSGLGMGSQTTLQFVPESTSDFIFTVIAEEMGFIGGLLLVLSYSVIIFFGYYTANLSSDFFLKIICYAASSLIFVHVAINLAMTTGLVPVVGIPLPMVSYGRTAALIGVILLGLISNAHINQRLNLSNI